MGCCDSKEDERPLLDGTDYEPKTTKQHTQRDDSGTQTPSIRERSWSVDEKGIKWYSPPLSRSWSPEEKKWILAFSTYSAADRIKLIGRGVPDQLRAHVWPTLLVDSAMEDNSVLTPMGLGHSPSMATFSTGALKPVGALFDESRRNLVRDAKRYRHLADRERWAAAPHVSRIHDEVKRVIFQQHTEQKLDPMYGEEDLRLALERVLNAYALYNPSVGFAHGIAYVAAPLLLYLGEEETFWALQLLYRRSIRYPGQEPEAGILRQVPAGDLTSMRMRVFQFERLIATHLPTVHARLKRDVDLPMFLTDLPWFSTVFTHRLPTKLSLRLFEGFQTEGFRFVLHASLAIFRWHSSAILSVIPGSLTSLLHAPCQEVDDTTSVDQFIASMAKIKLTTAEVDKWEQEYIQTLTKELSSVAE